MIKAVISPHKLLTVQSRSLGNSRLLLSETDDRRLIPVRLYDGRRKRPVLLKGSGAGPSTRVFLEKRSLVNGRILTMMYEYASGNDLRLF